MDGQSQTAPEREGPTASRPNELRNKLQNSSITN
jgi:hypothetical protein